MSADEEDKDSILYKLIKDDPISLAGEAAKRGDYRLISMAMGSYASAEDAVILGVNCSAPRESQSIVFGCVPPPAVIFKLMKQYNAALVGQRGFPEKENCKMDPRFDAAIEEMDRMEKKAEKKQMNLLP